MSKRILFLDFDGVVLPGKAAFLPHQTTPYLHFDPVAVALINGLARGLDLKIVVISSWRKSALAPDDLKQHIIQEGIDPLVIHADHKAPYKFTSQKATDITLWLEGHPEAEEWVVVDDDSWGFYHVMDHLVSPDYEEGFGVKEFLEVARKFGDHRPFQAWRKALHPD